MPLGEVRNSPTRRRSFLEIANDGDNDAVEPDTNNDEPGVESQGAVITKMKEVHLASEEEIERQKGILMRRVRLLRAECESLEQQIEQALQSKESAADVDKKIQQDIDTTMYATMSYLCRINR